MKAGFAMIPSILLHAAGRDRSLGAEIGAAGRALVAAFNRGDARAVAQAYADRGTMLAPGREVISGRDAIRGEIQAAIEAGLRVVGMRGISVVRRDEMVYEVGSYTLDIRGLPGRRGRKYLRIWRHTLHGWQIDADAWNDTPIDIGDFGG